MAGEQEALPAPCSAPRRRLRLRARAAESLESARGSGRAALPQRTARGSAGRLPAPVLSAPSLLRAAAARAPGTRGTRPPSGLLPSPALPAPGAPSSRRRAPRARTLDSGPARRPRQMEAAPPPARGFPNGKNRRRAQGAVARTGTLNNLLIIQSDSTGTRAAAAPGRRARAGPPYNLLCKNIYTHCGAGGWRGRRPASVPCCPGPAPRPQEASPRRRRTG